MKTGDPVAEGGGREDEALTWPGLSEARRTMPLIHTSFGGRSSLP